MLPQWWSGKQTFLLLTISTLTLWMPCDFYFFLFRLFRLNMSSWCSIRKWCGMCSTGVKLKSSPRFNKLSCTDRTWTHRCSLAFKPNKSPVSGKHGTSTISSHRELTPPTTCCNHSKLPRRVLARLRVSMIDCAIILLLRAWVVSRS